LAGHLNVVPRAPLGATVGPAGVNFNVFAKDATRFERVLFDKNDAQSSQVIPLHAGSHRAYHYRHAFVPGLGQVYAYRAFGPFAPERGMRFDAVKILLDPYGRAVAVADAYDRSAGSRPRRQHVFADPQCDRDLKRTTRARFLRVA